MQINGIQSNKHNSNASFGMALYMKDAKVFKKALGGSVAKNIEAARPVLEEMAKDVDIFVKPSRFAHNPIMPVEYIDVVVQEKNITLKDKIMRYFGQRPPYKMDWQVNPNFNPTKERLINTVADLKKGLLNWTAE